MIFGFEIGFLIFGLIGLVTGKLTLTKNKIIHGTPARLLGLVAMLPLPLAILIGLGIGAFVGATNPGANINDYKTLFAIVDLGSLAVCVLVVFVGAMLAPPPEPVDDRRRRDDRDERHEVYDDDFARERSRPLIAELVESPPAPPPPPVELPTLVCPCGTKLKIPTALAGKNVRCPKCQAVLTAPPLPPPVVPAIPPAAAATFTPLPERRPRRREPEPSRMSDGAVALIVVGLLLAIILLGGVGVAFYVNWNSGQPPVVAQNGGVNNAPKFTEKDFKIVGVDFPKGVEPKKKDETKGPPPEFVNPKVEPVFVPTPPVKVELVNGEFKTEVNLAGKPTDPRTSSNNMTFELLAKAGTIYSVQVPNNGTATVWVTGPGIEERAPPVGRHEVVVVATQDAAYTATVAFQRHHPVQQAPLSIREVDANQPLPLALRLKSPAMALPEVRPIELLNVYDKQWSGAAFHPKTGDFWMAHGDRSLTLSDHATNKAKGTFKTKSRLMSLGVDRNGRLYAQSTDDRGPISIAKLPVGDISIWEELDPVAAGAELPAPTKTIPLRGTVSRFANAPDGAWLYFLDVTNRKLGRINPETAAVDKEIDTISPGAIQVRCLTPNGKTLYCCSPANQIDVIDAATFTKTRTIDLEDGAPKDIAATNEGILYMVGKPAKREPNQFRVPTAFAVDLSPAKGKPPIVQPVISLPIDVHAENVVMLPDQRAVLFSGDRQVIVCGVVERPGLFQSPVKGTSVRDYFTRGRLALSPDGRVLLQDAGAILSISR